jgi:hypothetical protein
MSDPCHERIHMSKFFDSMEEELNGLIMEFKEWDEPFNREAAIEILEHRLNYFKSLRIWPSPPKNSVSP